MKICAILVTYNRLNKLKLAVSSMLAQSIDYIVIVNNCSSDGTKEWLDQEQDPRLRIEHLTENTGGSGGFHHGCKYATENLDADWLLLYDDDAYPAADLITKFRSLELNQATAAVTCAVYTPDGVLANFNRPGINPFKSVTNFLKFIARGNHYLSTKQLTSPKPRQVDLSSFVGFFVSTKLIKNGLGYPLKDLFIYCDDWLYSLKVSQLGYQNLYFSDLVFYHDSKTFTDDLDSQLWKKYYNYRNSIYFYKQAAGIFALIVIPLKISKWLVDARLYKHKREYFQVMIKALRDGFSLNHKI